MGGALERKLVDSDRTIFLNKAADIVISAMNGIGNHMAEDWPAKVLEKTYHKMIELMEKS